MTFRLALPIFVCLFLTGILTLFLQKKWRALIDGVEYKFELNSIPRWLTIKSHDSFTGKEVEIV